MPGRSVEPVPENSTLSGKPITPNAFQLSCEFIVKCSAVCSTGCCHFPPPCSALWEGFFWQGMRNLKYVYRDKPVIPPFKLDVYLISDGKRGSQTECVWVFSCSLCNTVNLCFIVIIFFFLALRPDLKCVQFFINKTKTNVTKVTGLSFTWLCLAT